MVKHLSSIGVGVSGATNADDNTERNEGDVAALSLDTIELKLILSYLFLAADAL